MNGGYGNYLLHLFFTWRQPGLNIYREVDNDDEFGDSNSEAK
jgi:hypothetical protein